MLSADKLTYRHIVSTVDLVARRGELLAVVGPNGAGKSTLLALFAGDLSPSSGSATLDGRPVSRLRPRDLARLRAVMPQSSELRFGFTVAEVVGLGAAAGNGGDVHTALSTVGAEDLVDRTFPTLSGGEQARVTLARVLAQRTPAVLLDEPTAHLDVRHQELVLGVARGLADEGRAVVAVLHDLGAAARYADRVAVLSAGRLVAYGAPAAALDADLLSDVYRHPISVVPHPLDGTPLPLPVQPNRVPETLSRCACGGRAGVRELRVGTAGDAAPDGDPAVR